MSGKATAVVPAPAEERLIESYADLAGLELESDGTEDIQPSFPVIKIVQPTSSMQGASKHAGEFYHSDSEAYEFTLDVVALLKHNTRALFPEGAVEPACASSDGIAPRPDQPLWRWTQVTLPGGEIVEITTRQPRSCAECPFAEWVGDNPPACRASSVLLVEREDGSLAQLRVGGKSLRPLRRFISRKLAPKKLPLFTQRLHLYTEERSEPGKKWFQLAIDATPLSRAAVERYNSLLRGERERFALAAAVEDHDEAPARTDDGWGDGQKPFYDVE